MSSPSAPVGRRWLARRSVGRHPYGEQVARHLSMSGDLPPMGRSLGSTKPASARQGTDSALLRVEPFFTQPKSPATSGRSPRCYGSKADLACLSRVSLLGAEQLPVLEGRLHSTRPTIGDTQCYSRTGRDSRCSCREPVGWQVVCHDIGIHGGAVCSSRSSSNFGKLRRSIAALPFCHGCA